MITNQLARERVRLAVIYSVSYLIIILIFSPIAGAMAMTLWGWSFQGITFLGLCAGGLAIANAWAGTYADVRWMLVETVATSLDNDDAEAERKYAEADAVRAASNSAVSQIAISSGGSVKQTFKPTVYKANEQIVHIGDTVKNGSIFVVDWKDVFFVLQWFCEYGHSRRKIVEEVKLPYSGLPVPLVLYEMLVEALKNADKITDRRQGTAGRLKDKNPASLMKVVRAAYPDGVRLKPTGDQLQSSRFSRQCGRRQFRPVVK